MADKKDQNIEAMAKLLLLTQKGKIDWSYNDPNLINRKTDDETISSVFTCSYKGNNLRIYRRKYKAPRLGVIPRGVMIGVNPTDDDWDYEVILEIINESGNSIWQFPREKILNDLLEAVRYKTSSAHDLIQSLLSDESDDEDISDLA